MPHYTQTQHTPRQRHHTHREQYLDHAILYKITSHKTIQNTIYQSRHTYTYTPLYTHTYTSTKHISRHAYTILQKSSCGIHTKYANSHYNAQTTHHTTHSIQHCIPNIPNTCMHNTYSQKYMHSTLHTPHSPLT